MDPITGYLQIAMTLVSIGEQTIPKIVDAVKNLWAQLHGTPMTDADLNLILAAIQADADRRAARRDDEAK